MLTNLKGDQLKRKLQEEDTEQALRTREGSFSTTATNSNKHGHISQVIQKRGTLGYFLLTKKYHQYPTRQTNDLVILKFQTRTSQRTFHNQAIKVWIN